MTVLHLFPDREGLRALQRRLQPLAHHGRRLPHAAPQNGRPSGRGHREAQERNRPQRRLPAPTVPTEREAGEGGQADRGGGQTKDQMRGGVGRRRRRWGGEPKEGRGERGKKSQCFRRLKTPPPTKPAPTPQTNINAFIFVRNDPCCSHTFSRTHNCAHTHTLVHTLALAHTRRPTVVDVGQLLLLCGSQTSCPLPFSFGFKLQLRETQGRLAASAHNLPTVFHGL